MSLAAYEPMFAPPPRHAVREAVLDLPSPPSTNNLYVTKGRKRVKSPKYERWISDTGWMLVTQKPGRVDSPFIVEILIPSTTRIDVDNSAKAIGDLLTRHGVIEDDNPRLCHGVSVRLYEGVNARVTVRSVA